MILLLIVLLVILLLRLILIILVILIWLLCVVLIILFCVTIVITILVIVVACVCCRVITLVVLQVVRVIILIGLSFRCILFLCLLHLRFSCATVCIDQIRSVLVRIFKMIIDFIHHIINGTILLHLWFHTIDLLNLRCVIISLWRNKIIAWLISGRAWHV